MKLISFISLTLFLTLLNSACFAEAQPPKPKPTPNTECKVEGKSIPSGQPYTNPSGKQYMCENGTLRAM